jgi:hypothetical protein
VPFSGIIRKKLRSTRAAKNLSVATIMSTSVYPAIRPMHMQKWQRTNEPSLRDNILAVFACIAHDGGRTTKQEEEKDDSRLLLRRTKLGPYKIAPLHPSVDSVSHPQITLNGIGILRITFLGITLPLLALAGEEVCFDVFNVVIETVWQP